MQILLVEDDLPLAKGLIMALLNQGYVVNHVVTGFEAIAATKTESPDIVILDIGLPDMDGLCVLQTIRKDTFNLAVMLLTARDSVDDKVSGLDCGADDYLAKPFEMSELFARLRVLERRLTGKSNNEINVGKVCLNPLNHSVTLNNRELELSKKEYMLLKSLMENAGKVLTRNVLEARLYSWEEELASNAMEVHIHHLRKKLGNDFIKTIRGVGYKVQSEAS